MKKIPIDALNIFQLLKGKWSLNRQFDNKTSSDFSGYASGETLLESNDETTLSYNEIVNAAFNNGVESTGTTSYKFKIEQNQLHQYLVTQSEEAYMFELNFFAHNSDKKQAKASYVCKQDRYDVVYTFLNDTQFNVIYTVTGPQKDYTTITSFKRIELIGEENNTNLDTITEPDSID